MPRRALRSRSLRQVKKKLSGKKVRIHYRPRKPSPATCSGCGHVLAGVPRATASVMQKIPRSQRSPNRPYAGVLCMNCLKEKLLNEVRAHV